MLNFKHRSIFTLICLAATGAVADDTTKSNAPAKKNSNVPRISSNIDVRSMHALTNEESNHVSFAAGRALKHVVQAREAIQGCSKDEAIKNVDQSLKLLAIISDVLPHFKVKAEIKTANQTYTDEEEVRPRYVTIFDELERRDIVSPVAQAKTESQQQTPKTGDSSHSSADSKPAVAVTHVDVNHSAMKLDLLLFNQFLSHAKQQLQENKLEEADQSLLTAQSRGILFEYEEVDLPLEEAADNLKLAEAEMLQGRISEAKAALHVAIDQLKHYEKLAGDTRSPEVKALHQEITKLTLELEKGVLSETEQKKLANQISEWWHSVTKWFKSRTK